MTTLLHTSSLIVRRGKRAVLRDVNLELRSGEITAIIGANGVGKSTLLSTLAGLRSLEHGDGEVRLGDEDIAALSKPAIAEQLAFLPAHSSVPFPLTVRELIGLAQPASDAMLEAIRAYGIGKLGASTRDATQHG
ncbi:MAG: ABC transporter ATP-binding protein [Pleurocapsa sp. SU_196_0]|nr:ABC transporter ATP-binding protein [Pleurocapsa sp. SU_196_0]